jgi:hypothetical protein
MRSPLSVDFQGASAHLEAQVKGVLLVGDPGGQSPHPVFGDLESDATIAGMGEPPIKRWWRYLRKEFIIRTPQIRGRHGKCVAGRIAGAVTGLFAGAGAGIGVAAAVPVAERHKLFLSLLLSVLGAVLGAIGGMFGGAAASGCYEEPEQ